MGTDATHKPCNIAGIIEIGFDSAYLLFALTSGIMMLILAGNSNRSLALYGGLALILGFGDAFHLIPRIYGHTKGCMEQLAVSLGVGRLITSMTMTIFYVLLYHVWLEVYGKSWTGPATAVLYALAALRILFSLFPQNGWFQDTGLQSWAILRNIPFALIGFMIVSLFSQTAIPIKDGFQYLPVAVVLSFACYLPVVLWAKRWPALGALMMPKTLAYVWIICMGFGLYSQ